MTPQTLFTDWINSLRFAPGNSGHGSSISQNPLVAVYTSSPELPQGYGSGGAGAPALPLPPVGKYGQFDASGNPILGGAGILPGVGKYGSFAPEQTYSPTEFYQDPSQVTPSGNPGAPAGAFPRFGNPRVRGGQ